MSVGPLGLPPVGGLKAGDRILVYYEGNTFWHTRYLLACVERSLWIIITPDGDIYAQEVSSANGDWEAWRSWPLGGGIPVGVDGNRIYRFNPEPDAGTLQQLLQEGDQHAQQERVRLGLGVPAPGAAAPVAPAAPAPAAVGGLGVGSGNAGRPVADLVPMAVDQGHGQMVGPGLGDLVGGADLAAASDDARTLSISRDPDGNRFKDFRAAVQQSRPVEFKDWPVSGPRTTRHVILQMIEHGGSALGHHQSWRVACKFQPTDGPSIEHESWCRVLHTLMCYDQLDVCNLAGVELVVRAIQRIEEKHKFKMMAADETGENSLFMGTSGGSRSGTVISPKLTEWIGGELQKEALIAKERRKAREERALSRKGDKSEKSKDEK